MSTSVRIAHRFTTQGVCFPLFRLKFCFKERRRKAWEQEQLRKKLEADIFGSNDGELKDAATTDDEHESAATIDVKLEENQTSSMKKTFVFAILIAVLAVYFKFVQAQ